MQSIVTYYNRGRNTIGFNGLLLEFQIGSSSSRSRLGLHNVDHSLAR